MAPSPLAKKLFRTFARVIPQCGMVSQAVAFNMFLAFFPTLLVALGLVSSSLRWKSGQELAVRLSEIGCARSSMGRHCINEAALLPDSRTRKLLAERPHH